MTPHYIVSDLHLADGKRRDDFKKNHTKFKNFLQLVKKQKAQLIIAGDFLELLQTNPAHIVRAYSDILNQLISLQAKAIIGNHDYYLHHFKDLHFLYDSYQIPGTKIFIQHGHQFDRFNDPERLMKLGNLAAIVGGFTEDIHPDLDERAMRFLQFLQRKMKWSPFCSPGTRAKEYVAQGGDFSEYLTGAKNLLKKYTHVVLGHTHQPGTAFETKYLNSGCWTGDTPTYVEVDKHAHCALRYWPSGKPVTTLLDTTPP